MQENPEMVRGRNLFSVIIVVQETLPEVFSLKMKNYDPFLKC